MKRLALALLVLPLGLVAPAGGAEDKLPESPWYPLRVGTSWQYKAGDGKFQVRVARHEKVGEAPAARLETVRDGKVVAVEHVGVTADGVYRYDLESSRDDQKLTEEYKPPILLLKLPPKKGETFQTDSKASGRSYKGTFKIGEEEVKVPAGTYKAVTVTSQALEVDGLKPTLTVWYAENVGMVKLVLGEGGQKVVLELEKFEPGK
jgi:hypothetical protein